MATLDSTLGAIEVGSFFSICLFGVLCAQVYYYYMTFRGESTVLDTAIAIIWCLDLGQTICITHATYVATITWYGHASHIDSLITIPSMPLSVLFSSLVEIAVRVVFIKRLMEFSGSRYAPGLCYILATATFGGGIWLCVLAFQAKTTSELVGEYKWLYIAAMSGIVISDMLIAATLCYYLKRSQRWLGRSSKLIDTLILWTIETGLLTSLTALVQLIFFQTMRHNFAYISVYTILPKLYSNTLLALLNGRVALRDIPPDDLSFSLHQGEMSGDACKAPPTSAVSICLSFNRSQQNSLIV